MKVSLYSAALVFSLVSCKQNVNSASTSALRDSTGNTTAAATEELSASDVSILVPLQSSGIDDPADSIYGKTGNGMCNAPSLDVGGTDPVLSEAMWQDWAKDTLMSVLPLPSNPDVWIPHDDGTPFGAADLAAIKTDMKAIPDVEVSETDNCPDPVGLSSIFADKVDLLRNDGTNVAVTQTLPSGACHYKNWHVVAVRFEPCSYRPTVLAENPSALDPKVNPTFPAEKCGGSELRLVLQPFTPQDGGGYAPLDMAIHAFYKIDDASSFVNDLRAFRAVTRQALAGKTGNGADAVWYADQKDLFIPHPGLREEMDCTSATKGPVGTAFESLVTKYAHQSSLFKMTWMASDNSGGNWSFGLRLVQPAAGTTAPRLVKRQENFKDETFTVSQISRGFPYTPFDLSMNTVDYFYKDGRTDKTLTTDAAIAATKELIDISNPDLTSFNVGGKHGASCASCHTRDQTEKAVRTRTGKTYEQLAALAGTPSISVPMWDPIKKAIDKRNDNNLRNFGYGPASTLGVSRRALNETAALRQVLNDYFKPGQPAAAPVADSPSQSDPSVQGAFLANAPVTPDFTNDVRPVLEARCGYCHGIKKAPALLNQETAEAYSEGIVRNICSQVLSYQHMPPGKTIPGDERDLVLRWANSLAPDEEPLTCSQTTH